MYSEKLFDIIYNGINFSFEGVLPTITSRVKADDSQLLTSIFEEGNYWRWQMIKNSKYVDGGYYTSYEDAKRGLNAALGQ